MNETTDTIDTQPDDATGGFFDDVGETVLDSLPGTLNALNDRLAGGRHPYDPSNPNVQAIRPRPTASKTSSMGGLILIALIIWAVAG